MLLLKLSQAKEGTFHIKKIGTQTAIFDSTRQCEISLFDWPYLICQRLYPFNTNVTLGSYNLEIGLMIDTDLVRYVRYGQIMYTAHEQQRQKKNR